jgi:2-polyprenyl-3-methyl-5-hydroxy-6-metoxy-1,4-benzoquinol methylase
MNSFFLKFFESGGKPFKVKGDTLTNGTESFPIRNDIPRFTKDVSYSSGNFSSLREKHAKLQIDSENGTTHRMDTMLYRTQWPADFFKNKFVLECGCGAGPDTEVLVRLGAKVVAVDIAGVDIAKENLKNSDNVQFVQDSIDNLHLKPKSFDIVFCHRVLQHTPNPEKTMNHILQFVKDDGAAFVHSYSSSRYQTWRWKYFLRPVTKFLPSELLYKIIKLYSRPAFHFTNLTNRFKAGEVFNHFFVPFLNYRKSNALLGKSDEYIIEYGVHDTFDALSPRYDRPLSAKKMREIGDNYLKREFEIITYPTITLLRSKT